MPAAHVPATTPAPAARGALPLPPLLLALVGVALPMLIAGSLSPASTYFNQLIAFAGMGLWVLMLARVLPRGGWADLGLPAQLLLLAMALLAEGYLISDAPYGQRIIPLGCVMLGAALAAAAATCARAGDEASLVGPLMMGLAVAALASVAVAMVQVFMPAWADGNLIALPTTPGRAIGNMRQPNQLATLLLWGCGAVTWLAVARRWALPLLGGLLALLVFGVVLTASRTGLVGVFLLAFWGAVDRRLPGRVRLLLVASLAAYALGWWLLELWSSATGQAFFGDDQVEKTLHGDASSSRGRIWRNTLALIAQYPWRGVGAAAYNYVWSMTPFPDRPIAFFDHSHNLELQLAVENGIPFAVAVLGLLLAALWLGRGALTAQDDRRARSARVVLFMLAHVAVHSQLEYPLWYVYFLLPTCVLAGWYVGHAAGDRLDRSIGAVLFAAPGAALSRREDLTGETAEGVGAATADPGAADPPAADPPDLIHRKARRTGKEARVAAPDAATSTPAEAGAASDARAKPAHTVRLAPRIERQDQPLGLHQRLTLAMGVLALTASMWAVAEYWRVAVVFEPQIAFGDPGPLDRRIALAQRSVLFGHHADYAAVTMAERPQDHLAEFDRPLYHLLDTRIMMAYARALAGSGHPQEAAHVAARLREFHNPASDEFFAPCADPAVTDKPFQCGPDPRLPLRSLRVLQQR